MTFGLRVGSATSRVSRLAHETTRTRSPAGCTHSLFAPPLSSGLTATRTTAKRSLFQVKGGSARSFTTSTASSRFISGSKLSDFASNVSGRFVYYFMRQFFGAHAMENSVKATVDSLRLPTFTGFEIQLPSLEEQHAIVEVLDAVESELASLDERLAKARAIKTGMMQELLTGRTRLVPQEAVA